MIKIIESPVYGRMEFFRLTVGDVVRDTECVCCAAPVCETIDFGGEHLCSVCFAGAIASDPEQERELTRTEVLAEVCRAFCVEDESGLSEATRLEIDFQLRGES